MTTESLRCEHCGAKTTPGVEWRPDRNVFRVRIRVGKRRMNIGHYKSRDEAVTAYNRARVVLAEVQAQRSTTTTTSQKE